MPFPFAIWRKNFVYVENNLERYLRHLSKHFKVEFFFNSTGYQILITYHDHNLTYSFTVKGGIFGGNFKCLLRGGLTYLYNSQASSIRSNLCETLFTFIFDESRGTKNVRPQAKPAYSSVIDILRVVKSENRVFSWILLVNICAVIFTEFTKLRFNF